MGCRTQDRGFGGGECRGGERKDWGGREAQYLAVQACAACSAPYAYSLTHCPPPWRPPLRPPSPARQAGGHCGEDGGGAAGQVLRGVVPAGAALHPGRLPQGRGGWVGGCSCLCAFHHSFLSSFRGPQVLCWALEVRGGRSEGLAQNGGEWLLMGAMPGDPAVLGAAGPGGAGPGGQGGGLQAVAGGLCARAGGRGVLTAALAAALHCC